MKYQPGESGNPKGRRKGSINKRTELAKLLEPHAEELIKKLVELAKNGDVGAIRLCVERLLPKIKDEPVIFDLPDNKLNRVDGLLQIGEKLIEAIAFGELTPEQGQKITVLLEAQRKIIETMFLSQRIAEIEHVLKKKVEIYDKA